jgi:hypothetical protein
VGSNNQIHVIDDVPVGGHRSDVKIGEKLAAVHLPELHLTIIRPPQDVASAVNVEIPSGVDVPIRRHRADVAALAFKSALSEQRKKPGRGVGGWGKGGR